MASGRADSVHRRTGKMVCIVDRDGSPRDSPMWWNVPFIAQSLENTARMLDAPYARPHVEAVSGSHIIFKRNHWPTPGTLSISRQELRDARELLKAVGLVPGGFCVFHPYVKRAGSGVNKDWGCANWSKLALGIRTPIVHLPSSDHRPAPFGVPLDCGIRTAFAVISQAMFLVTTDSVFHHAAAALQIPTVALWGGFSSVDTFGYRNQINVCSLDSHCPCGSLRECPRCRQLMEGINVEEVARHIECLRAD